MNNRFMKDVFAIAIGAFLGAMLAHAMGGFWLIGILAGGAVGYVTRGLAEPRHVGNSVQRAFRAAFYRYPIRLFNGGWQRIKIGFTIGTLVGSGIGTLFAVLTGLIYIAGLSIKSPQFHLISYFGFAIGVPVLLASGFALAAFLSASNEQIDVGDPFDDPRTALYHNSITWHFYAVWYALVGCWLFLKWLPSAPRHFTLAALFTGHFLVLFARFVHREDFSACGVYALVAALGIFLYIPNEPIPIALAAFIGGISGALARRILLRFVFATS